MPTRYDQNHVLLMINHLAELIAGQYAADRPLIIIGIRTRGEVLADRLSAVLKLRGHTKIARGVLDITLYRDDLSEIGPRPLVRPTEITVDINQQNVILVDDVLFTGRTVRAALDALADLGRPRVIRLAILVDRGGRELPIAADYIGLNLGQLETDRVVKVKLSERDSYDGIEIEARAVQNI